MMIGIRRLAETGFRTCVWQHFEGVSRYTIDGQEVDETTWQAHVQWKPSSSISASATWNRPLTDAEVGLLIPR
jgi:hypothetical protein